VILASLNRSSGALHTPPNPINFSAKITKQTKRVHYLQNWSGDELMSSGEIRMVTSPDAIATKFA
tara:strand:+ start:2394 stop:2588 length:195 start_codon:yes stop_codon:yes gene_type:complete